MDLRIVGEKCTMHSCQSSFLHNWSSAYLGLLPSPKPQTLKVINCFFAWIVCIQNAATQVTLVLQTDAGLESLDVAMKSGFDQFNKIRNDPNLEKLRQSQKFKTLMDQYDEPVIDTNLFKSASLVLGYSLQVVILLLSFTLVY